MTKAIATTSRSDQYKADAQIVRDGVDTFRAVVEAAARIKDSGSWKDVGNYETWGDWCQCEFNCSRVRIAQLTNAAKVMKALPDGIEHDVGSLTESHLRELNRMPEEDREQVLRYVAGNPDGGGVTAERLVDRHKTVVNERLNDEDAAVDLTLAKEGKPKFMEIMFKLRSVKTLLGRLGSTPAGRDLNVASAQADTGNVIALLRFATPHAMCVYCERGCKACDPGETKKRGWMSLGAFKQAGAAQQEGATIL